MKNKLHELLEPSSVGLYEPDQFFDNQILTGSEASKFLKISTRTLYRRVSSGEIPFKKVGRHYRFSTQSLLEWIKEGG